MQQLRSVLIADGDKDFCQLLTAALEQTGLFLVNWEGEGPQALEHILSAPPDILVIDTALPGLEGLELLRILQNRRIVIPNTFVVSSFVRQDTAAEAAALGASYFLPKPFTLKCLAGAVQERCM